MSTKTQQQNQTAQQEPMGDGRSKGAVSVLQPTRLPYHPIYQERYGIDGVMWRALVEGLYPSAQTPEGIILAVSYCKSRGLDIMKKPVHVVPIWNSKLKKSVEGVWPGIGELRTTASRTGAYAGCDETEFGPMKTTMFKGNVGYDDKPKMVELEVTYPEWARVTVYRIVGGVRCAFPGPKVSYLGAYGTVKQTDVPNDKWSDDPSYMLEKCAEAAALRKAFPEELQGMHAAEEMMGRTIDDHQGPTIDHEPAPPKPTRQSVRAAEETARQGEYEMNKGYRQTVGGEGPVRTPPLPAHDEQTGEVDEANEPEPAPASDDGESSENPPADDPQPSERGQQAASDNGEFDAIEDRVSGLIARAATLSNLNKIIANNQADIDKLRTSATGHHGRVMQKIDDKRKWFAR